MATIEANAKQVEKPITKTVEHVFLAQVKAQVGGDRKHGWGVEDSLAVILALNEHAEKESLGYDDEHVVKYTRMVINPSAFRQVLEGKKILDEPVGRKRATSDAFALYDKV